MRSRRFLPMNRAVIARLRSEQGFGLIELLISMVMLNVGILAIVAAFSSGALALQRASETSTASVLADKQLELYRAVTYASIALDTTSKAAADANSTYSSDTAWTTAQTTTTCSGSPLPYQCDAMRTVTGPDGVSYRVDTYVVAETPPTGRAVKRVTVVIRKSSTLKTLARVTSTFDQATG